MNDELYAPTQSGMNAFDVLRVLYRENKFLSVDELVKLSDQPEKTVRDALAAFQEMGMVECLVDAARWGMTLEARQVAKEMELRTGRRI